MFLPFLPIVVIETHMTELVDDGCYGRLSSKENLHVALVDCGRRAELSLCIVCCWRKCPLWWCGRVLRVLYIGNRAVSTRRHGWGNGQDAAAKPAGARQVARLPISTPFPCDKFKLALGIPAYGDKHGDYPPRRALAVLAPALILEPASRQLQAS